MGNPQKLTVPQAALLATVLNNPTVFDPYDKSPTTKKRILERYRYVLDGMRQTGTITDAQAQVYSKQIPKVVTAKRSDRFKGPQGFLLDMARKELVKVGIPEDEISGGGLRVVTTFDKKLQDDIVKAGTERLPKKRQNLHVGLASVKPGTGELVAMYGGPDYLKSQLNWATLKARPGSSFKPFALAAALKDGRSIYDVFQGDSPIEVQGLKLNNEFDEDYGDVSLLKATQESINTAFYDLVDKQMDNGPDKLVDAAEAAGIPPTTALERGRNNPSTVLGPDPYASPVDMANAYATFAAGGKFMPVHTIKSVKGLDNKTKWSEASLAKQGKQAFEPDVANTVNYVLQNVVEKGTGEDAKELDRPVVSKTGTAGGVALEHRAANAKCDGCKDGDDTLTSWWAAYTPQLSTAVLYRAASGEGDLDPYSSDKAFFGGNWPVKTWLAFMEAGARRAGGSRVPRAGRGLGQGHLDADVHAERAAAEHPERPADPDAALAHSGQADGHSHRQAHRQADEDQDAQAALADVHPTGQYAEPAPARRQPRQRLTTETAPLTRVPSAFMESDWGWGTMGTWRVTRRPGARGWACAQERAPSGG